MNLEKFIRLIGKSASDEELTNAVSIVDVNLKKELQLPDGEYRAYIECPKSGFSLVFTDKAVFLGKTQQSIGIGDLYFSGIFLYAEGKDGYSKFQGDLPNGLSFDSTNEELVRKLGTPSWERSRPDGSKAADRWDDLADYRIHITYSKESGKPVVISLNRADAK